MPGRNWIHLTRRTRGLALGTVAILAMPVGFAHMAQNSLPISHAGRMDLDARISTTLTAREASYVASSRTVRYTAATLRHASAPLSSAPIDFWVGDRRVCEGVLTNARGQATCTAPYPAGASTYRVVFKGLGAFQPSEATGRLILGTVSQQQAASPPQQQSASRSDNVAGQPAAPLDPGTGQPSAQTQGQGQNQSVADHGPGSPGGTEQPGTKEDASGGATAPDLIEATN